MATVYAEIGKTEYSGTRLAGITDTVNTIVVRKSASVYSM